jgi:hypothetical protein
VLSIPAVPLVLLCMVALSTALTAPDPVLAPYAEDTFRMGQD